MMKYSWTTLLGAILSEVAGTCAMKWGQLHAPFLGYLAMYAMIALSYGLLSIAIKRIPLALSYAVWEGAGLICITVMGSLFFHETMSPIKLIALICIISGIFLLKSGSVLPNSKVKKPTSPMGENHVAAHT
jgi:spermidine export protein MdtJ